MSGRRIPSLAAPFLREISLVEGFERSAQYPLNLGFLTDQNFPLQFERPITILVGENGSGKSTLLEAIAIGAGFSVTGGGRNQLAGALSDSQPMVDAFRFSWLAELLDISQARVSRFETGEEYPSLAIALGFQIIFGRAPRTCFASAYTITEEGIMTRAATFERLLAAKRDIASAKKRHLLEAMMARVSSQPTA